MLIALFTCVCQNINMFVLCCFCFTFELWHHSMMSFDSTMVIHLNHLNCSPRREVHQASSSNFMVKTSNQYTHHHLPRWEKANHLTRLVRIFPLMSRDQGCLSNHFHSVSRDELVCSFPSGVHMGVWVSGEDMLDKQELKPPCTPFHTKGRKSEKLGHSWLV